MYSQAQSDTEKTLKKAESLFYDDKHEESIQLLKQVTISDPNNYKAYLWLSLNYRELKNIQEREIVLKKAIAVAPFVPEVYYRYGGFLSGSKRYWDAKALYDQGIKNIPKDAEMYYLQSSVMTDLELYEESLPYIDQAIGLDSTRNAFFS